MKPKTNNGKRTDWMDQKAPSSCLYFQATNDRDRSYWPWPWPFSVELVSSVFPHVTQGRKIDYPHPEEYIR